MPDRRDDGRPSDSDASIAALASQHALAIVTAIPASLLAVGAAETCSLPWSLMKESPSRLVGVLALAAAAAARFLWPAIGYQACVAILIAMGAPGMRRRIGARLLLGFASAIIAYLGYWILVRDEALARHPPFVAAFLFLAALLMSWTQLVFPSPARGSRLVWLRRTRIVFAVGFATGFVVVQLLNYRLLRGTYPSLHASGLLVAYLFAHAGLTVGLVSTARANSSRRVTAMGVAALLGLFALMGASRLGIVRQIEPLLTRHTYVGDASASMGNADDWFDQEPVALVPIPPDPDGLLLFDRDSGLPVLPERLSIAGLNVLLISIEATRFDATSLASPAQETTPNILTFASDGAYWFSRAYTAAPMTYQSMSSMFTMTIPSAAGISVSTKIWRGQLRNELPTVSALLSQEGYRSFWVGHDLRLNGAERGFETQTRIPAIPGLRSVDQQIRVAAERELDRASTDDRPFFGWVFFVSPHEPYLRHYAGMPAATKKDRYLQEVRQADEQVGLLLRHLAQTGLLERTVVIIHGDHGEEFDEHGGEFHTNVYEECIRVPLVIRVPGVHGGRQDAPTSLTYVFPWLLRGSFGAAAEAAKRRIVEDLAPLMARTDGAVVSERLWKGRMRTSLTWADEVTVFDFRSRAQELYSWQRDPAQRDDLFRSDANAAQAAVRRMRGYLEFRKARGRIGYVEPEDVIEAHPGR